MNFRKVIEFVIIAFIPITCFPVIYFLYDCLLQEYNLVLTLDALWATVILTCVLVVVNIYYAWQNRRTISEMEIARKTEFLPHLRAELMFLGPVYLLLKLTNFGKGPAIDIQAEIVFQPSEEKRMWEQSIMSPNEVIRILLPDGNINRVCMQSAIIVVNGEYKDVFGQIFEIDEKIDTDDFIEKAKQLKPIIESNIVEEIKGINKEIADIRREIQRTRENEVIERLRSKDSG